MRFDSPDDVFWRYAELCERVSSPRPATPSTEDGWRFARHCRSCHARDRVWKIEDGWGSWVCSTCSKPWGVWPCFRVPESVVRAVVPNLADKLSELDRLHRLLDLPLWERRLYLELALWAGIKPYKRVASEANKRWRPRKRFTEWTARKTVEGGRSRLWRAYSGERVVESRQIAASP